MATSDVSVYNSVLAIMTKTHNEEVCYHVLTMLPNGGVPGWRVANS